MSTEQIKVFEQAISSAEKEKEISQDWVPVDQEPQHHHRFQNDYVRVYDVRFKPKEHSLYHKHDKNTFYVSVYATQVFDQTYGKQKGMIHDLPAGMGICRGHQAHPLIHQVKNMSAHLMHMIGAEHLKTPLMVSKEVFTHPKFQHLDNTGESNSVRLYKMTLQPGESTGKMQMNFYALFVVLTDSSVQVDDISGSTTQAYSPGSHYWQEPKTLTITNVGELPHEVIVGEWQ